MILAIFFSICENIFSEPRDTNTNRSGSKKGIYIVLSVVCDHHECMTDRTMAIDHTSEKPRKAHIDTPIRVNTCGSKMRCVEGDEGEKESSNSRLRDV